VSYLEKLVWLLTGNLAQPGGQYAPATFVPIVRASRNELDPRTPPRSPVVGARILTGLIPCNVIPDEILTDHPKRYRALIVESGNPAHSLADSQRMREAIATLDVVVAIDVFMTETARLADYVLPAATQFEKYEATSQFEFPRNVFHLRRPLLTPPAGPCPSPRSTRASSKPPACSRTPSSSLCGPRHAVDAANSRRRSPRRPKRIRDWARSRRSSSTARSEKRFRTAPPRRRPCGPSRIAARA